MSARSPNAACELRQVGESGFDDGLGLDLQHSVARIARPRLGQELVRIDDERVHNRRVENPARPCSDRLDDGVLAAQGVEPGGVRGGAGYPGSRSDLIAFEPLRRPFAVPPFDRLLE